MNHDNQNKNIKASPAARRVARELGLDLHEIAQDVPGRIQIKDVELYHQKMLSAQETIQAEMDQIDQEIQEELVKEKMQALEDITETVVSEAVPVPEINQETEVTEIAEAQEDLPTQVQEDASVDTIHAEEESEATPIAPEQNFVMMETVEPEPELPILIDQPKEPVLKSEAIEPESVDELIVQSDEIEDLIEEDDDEDLFIPPIPISISFEVSDLPIRNMLSGLDVPLKEGLVDAVVKACCSAFVKAEISLYESLVNLVKIKEKNLLIQTATNFENHKISELEYTASQEDDDILINIWDMTDYEFNSVQKADVDSINLFILWNKDKITVDLTCDEFIMEIGECTYYMHMLKKYLDNPILMLL